MTELPAGLRRLRIRDTLQDADIDTVVFYPSAAPERAVAVGPYTLNVAVDAPPAAGAWPLAVLSHGNGGAPLLYRTIALHLARHGWVVAMPAHPGNTRGDNGLANTDANLANRPRHVRLVLDAVQADAALGPVLRPGPVAAIGHSLGGYTALALAGGQPWTREGHQVPVQADTRIGALVLLAPAAAYFMPAGALDAVRVPVLMLDAEHDVHTPRWQAEVVRNGLPDPSRLMWRTVPGAGHFSFLSPYPAALRQPGLAPAMDPPGFDRAAFHRALPEEILGFLSAALGAPGAGA